MALGTFDFYTDAGLTNLFVGPLTPTFDVGGSPATVDFSLYLGSTNAALKLQDSVSPGINQIAMTISDASPGSGPEATHVRLANSLLNLDTAIAGAPLNLGIELLGGVAGAFQIFFRFSFPGAGNTGLDISIGTANNVIEVAV